MEDSDVLMKQALSAQVLKQLLLPLGIIVIGVLFRNTIFGDLLYTTSFILLFELLQAIAAKRALKAARRT